MKFELIMITRNSHALVVGESEIWFSFHVVCGLKVEKTVKILREEDRNFRTTAQHLNKFKVRAGDLVAVPATKEELEKNVISILSQIKYCRKYLHSN